MAFWEYVLAHLLDLWYLKLVEVIVPEPAPVLSITPRDYMENYGGDTNRGQRQIFALVLEELGLHDILFSLVLERDIDLLNVAGVTCSL